MEKQYQVNIAQVLKRDGDAVGTRRAVLGHHPDREFADHRNWMRGLPRHGFCADSHPTQKGALLETLCASLASNDCYVETNPTLSILRVHLTFLGSADR